jgi:tRNA A-37 threonylcarbamoyl transferase component Bud32
MASKQRALLGGRYRIGELLGEGATATVSRAADQLLHRDVAIKLLKPTSALDATLLERFYAEARAAAALVDPRIVGIYDILAEGSLHAIVMEYVDGPSLAAVLTREGKIGETRAVRYARRIAQALAAAHARGILHRDIKPGNVLLTPDDDAKVTDFGLAKAFEGTDPELTQAGEFVGSAHYFSPEQAQGSTLTPASDLYSLGIVIYQLVTGSLPFDASSPVSIAVAHVTAPAPTEASLARAMTPGLAAIVARLLAKDPQARFESAAELDAALGALDGAPAPDPAWNVATIMGGAVNVPPRAPRKAARRLRAGTFAVVTAAAAAVAAAASAALASVHRRSSPVVARLREGLRSHTPGWIRDLKPQNSALAAAMLLLLVVVTSIAAWPRSFALADVRHASLAQARAKLTSLGLSTAISNRADETAAAGTVIAQSPLAHAAVHRGDVVQITVSSAPMVTMPNLLGTSYRSARQAMRRSKLVAKFAARVAAVPANVVMEQYPAAGTQVRTRTQALVVISAGPQPPVIMTGYGDYPRGWRKHHRYGGHGGGGDGGD